MAADVARGSVCRMPRPTALLLLTLAMPGGGAEVGAGGGMVLPGTRAGGVVGSGALLTGLAGARSHCSDLQAELTRQTSQLTELEPDIEICKRLLLQVQLNLALAKLMLKENNAL